MKTKPDATIYPFNLTDGHYGLTKREYFAAVAMQGLCSYGIVTLNADMVCKKAVALADRLIEKLNEGKDE
jgi:hypothetical protein